MGEIIKEIIGVVPPLSSGAIVKLLIPIVICVLLMWKIKNVNLFVVGISLIWIFLGPFMIFINMKIYEFSSFREVGGWEIVLFSVGVSIVALMVGMVFARFHDARAGEDFSIIVTLAVGPLTVLMALLYLIFGWFGFMSEAASDSSSSSSKRKESYTPPKSKTESEEKTTEVYKEHIHADGSYYREKMKVNSTGDMYFDPSDGDWHKI